MKENWTYKKLGEVGSIITGSTPSTKDEENYSSNDYCFVKPSDISKDGISIIEETEFHVSKKGFDSSRKLPKGSVLTTCIGIIGKVGILQKDAICNQQINAIIPSSVIDSKFLALAIYSIRNEMEIMANAPVVPIINKTDFSNFKIPVPPTETQSRIVSELDLLQSIIDKQKAQLKELDNLAQAVFYNMFGDPVENEKGWEVKKLGDECTDMKYGTSRPSCENGKYSYLRMCNISSDGHLDLNNLKTIDVPDDEVEKCIVRYGDILFNRTNSIDLIGKTCMFDLETPMIIAGYIIRVRLSEKLESRFVSCMFNMPSMKKLLRAMAKGAVNQANINSKELASIIIPIPPVILQHSFASKIESIEKQKAAITQSIAETQRLFDYTMDKYFG